MQIPLVFIRWVKGHENRLIVWGYQMKTVWLGTGDYKVHSICG